MIFRLPKSKLSVIKPLHPTLHCFNCRCRVRKYIAKSFHRLCPKFFPSCLKLLYGQVLGEGKLIGSAGWRHVTIDVSISCHKMPSVDSRCSNFEMDSLLNALFAIVE